MPDACCLAAQKDKLAQAQALISSLHGQLKDEQKAKTDLHARLKNGALLLLACSSQPAAP